MVQEKAITGYPSSDKPWQRYYPENVCKMEINTQTMYQFIYESNKNRLNNTAILYFGRSITYKELFDNIKKAACAFWNMGIKKGDIVSVLSLNTPETVYTIYGLNYIGATVNLMVASITAHEVMDNITNTESKLLVILDKVLEKYDSFVCPVPVVVVGLADSMGCMYKAMMKPTSGKKKGDTYYSDIIKESIERDVPMVSSEDFPALILYTSGTTGAPKGVILSNNNINSCALQCALSGKDYKPEEAFLNILPPFFSFGMGMLHLCFYVGMKEIAVLLPKINTVMKMMKKYRPERMVIGPAITDVIENYRGKDLSFLIDLTGGGGAISLEKERCLNDVLINKKAKSKYLVGYGMTELSAAVSMNHNHFHKEQSIGIPLPLTNVKVIDIDNGEELQYGQEGELLVSSPGVMKEYYNNEVETGKVVETDREGTRWLHTGDLAKIDEEGFVYITGRLKRIYITRDKDNMAYKIFPQRMEEIIEQEPVVQRCGVIVVKDEDRLNVPIVFVVARESGNMEQVEAKVKKIIHEKLPAYYEPKKVMVVDALPITSSQKIDYKKLEKMAEEY